jgi:hypothetical protein
MMLGSAQGSITGEGDNVMLMQKATSPLLRKKKLQALSSVPSSLAKENFNTQSPVSASALTLQAQRLATS